MYSCFINLLVDVYTPIPSQAPLPSSPEALAEAAALSARGGASVSCSGVWITISNIMIGIIVVIIVIIISMSINIISISVSISIITFIIVC